MYIKILIMKITLSSLIIAHITTHRGRSRRCEKKVFKYLKNSPFFVDCDSVNFAPVYSQLDLRDQSRQINRIFLYSNDDSGRLCESYVGDALLFLFSRPFHFQKSNNRMKSSSTSLAARGMSYEAAKKLS